MAPKPDLIFTGGWIFTARSNAPARLAVAVSEGRITAVGPDVDVLTTATDGTEIVDLDGGLLIPGFQDAHVHPVSGGMELLQCNLTEAQSAADSLARIDGYAAENPEAEWILGGGWSMEHFPGGTPTRQALDAIVPDRPVLLANRDHHGVWANTRAFELAGINALTQDPVDGRLEREPDGYPAGTVHEGAMNLFDKVRPAVHGDLLYAGLLRAQEELFSLGITGWQDAAVGALFGAPDTLDTYRRAIAEGTLEAHVVGALWWEREPGLEQIPRLIERRSSVAAELPGELFSAGTVKIMVDGVAENFTAAMTAPYLDNHGHSTDNAGLSFIDPERLKEYVTALDAAGFQVHFHALGDRAVREALDAVEAARLANGPKGNRHQIAHLQLVSEVDAPRFAELDVVVNMQALWACHETHLDELTLPFLPAGAEARHYPFGELLASGARLAAGSDWPVSSANPVWAIHVAVNRVAPGSSDEVLGDALQRLDLATALTAYTAGTAYANHRDHNTGAIAQGYFADLAVLRPNPFELAPTDIHTAAVVSTWVRGEQVYAAPGTH
ncbi:amidohydrolase [Arthrobacter sp. MI7-26]|uniref:amidohydrolase n=1 Tax=Arthrobacter sp. MI7-26 TaxID=2993653 RepID=UPI002249244D|nr:amidohydrolase [Arthrobacter sp. MI7-26]MCX2747870.1 amidohydrolase [Arthrobacter sp. MI7-26]